MLETTWKTAATVVHLCLWCQLGVLSRIYLNLLFQNGCNGHWGVCLTSSGKSSTHYSAYFTDLPPNMLGSFLMGLFAAASTLGDASGKLLLLLPGSHAWQTSSELHIGLRTGYCGSLTTFASWELQMVTMIIGGAGAPGGQWGEALWGWVVGTELSLASLALGQQCALLVHHHVCRADSFRDAKATAQAPALPQADLAAQRSRSTPEEDVLAAAQAAEQERHRESIEEGFNDMGEVRLSMDDHGAGQQPAVELTKTATASLSTPDDQTLQPRSRCSSFPPNSGTGSGQAVKERVPTSKGHTHAPDHPLRSPAPDPSLRLLRKTDAAALALLAMLTALWVVLAIVDRHPQHETRRSHWFALLFGPPGCLLRWQLARLNYQLPGRWSWLPVGTFAANILACAIDFIIAAVLVRTRTQRYWARLITTAVMAGFGGSLSTVSTWVVEIQAQLKAIMRSVHGYVYAVGTIVAGLLAGVVLYGWSVWA